MRLGPALTLDPVSERFTGDHASDANALLKPPMREELAIPDSV